MAGRYGPFSGQGGYSTLQTGTGQAPNTGGLMQTGLNNPAASPQSPQAPSNSGIWNANFTYTDPQGKTWGTPLPADTNYMGPPTGDAGTAWNPGMTYMPGFDAGGVVPDTQGVPDLEAALASVQDALANGRQSFGLPAQLGSGNRADDNSDSDGSANDDDDAQQMAGNIPARPAGPGGDQPNTNPFPTKTPRVPFGKLGGRHADASDTDDNSVVALADGGTVPAGVPGAANPDEGLLLASQAQREGMQKAKLAAKEGQGKDVLHPGGNAYADGGVIPDGGDTDNPNTEGISQAPQDNVPVAQQGQTRPDPELMQSLQKYGMGAGAVSPDVAVALEQRVDPSVSMDPSQRKLLAVAAAPNNAKFGLLQHYRQRYNALNTFARVASQGTDGRPANIAAATEAATRAFHNVPNGLSVNFHPAGPGHVGLTVAKYAGGKTQRGYDDGGAVIDDSMADDPTGGSPIPDAPPGGFLPASMTDIDQMDQGANDPTGSANAVPEGEDTGLENVIGQLFTDSGKNTTLEGVKHFVMTNPQFQQFLQKAHFDEMMDNGAKALHNLNPLTWFGIGADAAPAQSKGQPIAQPAAQPVQYQNIGGLGPSAAAAQPAATQPAAAHPATSPEQTQAERDVRPFGNDPNEITVLPDHPTRAQIDAFNASNGGVRPSGPPAIPPDIQAQANALFPMVGAQQAQRNAYIAQRLGIQQQQQQATNLQKLRNEGTRELWGARENAINARASARDAGALQRAQLQAAQRAYAAGIRTVGGLARAIANGGTVTPEIWRAAQSMVASGGNLLGAPGAASQLPPQARSQLQEGVHTKFSNGQVWTLQGGVPTQVQ